MAGYRRHGVETIEVSTEEAAQRLGVSGPTIRRRCIEGSLDARKIGKGWVIRLSVCVACGKASEA